MRGLRVQTRNSRLGISASSDSPCEGRICIDTASGLRCPIRPLSVRSAPSAGVGHSGSAGDSISWRSNS